MVHLVDLLLFECLLSVVQHIFHIIALTRIFKVKQNFLVAKLSLVLSTGLARRVLACHLPSHIVVVFNAHAICLVRCIIHRESNHEVALILPIDHWLNVYQRHFLVDYDSVLVLNWEVGLDNDEELRVNHHVPYTHLLVYSLVTEDQLYVHWRQLIRLTASPRVNYCLLAWYRVDIALGIFRSAISFFNLWFYEELNSLSQIQEYLNLCLQDVRWLRYII